MSMKYLVMRSVSAVYAHGWRRKSTLEWMRMIVDIAQNWIQRV